jgi:putative addiction module component (TIGR02574 family)
MGNQLELLEAEILMLPVNERAALAQLLLASLDEENEFEQAWAVEAERRLREIETGVVQTISLAEALAQIRVNLR